MTIELPIGCGQRETQAHMAMCNVNSIVKPPTKAELEERLGKISSQVALAHAFILTPSVLVSEAWAQDVKDATTRDNSIRKGKKGAKVPGRTTFETNMQHQIIERTEYIYDRWKERNDQQIQREEQSTIKPLKRRQIMRQPQLTARSRDSRTAAVPPIARPWGDDLLDFEAVAIASVALELRVITCDCRVPPPPRVA
ncbi:hypothetical protein GGH13_006047 [Coemansia sp. S155-1]|nr:hypothetical protein GGH13_006047 [Coemansia sp. S155-1]